MSSFASGRSAGALGCAIFLSMLVGCAGGPKIPPTAPVSGKITYQDKPLAGAEVGFVSAADNKSVLPARGVTNAAGEYKLSTYIDPQHDVAGATLGDFVVIVSKDETMDQQKMMEEFKNNPAMVFKKLVPAKYTDAKESPLKASVTAAGPNKFDFKLED